MTTDENSKLTEDVTVTSGTASAVVAQGTQLELGVTQVTLTATPLESSGSDVVLESGEEMLSMDVHLDGVAADNTVPVLVTLDQIAPEFLNQGNITLYHVENGVTVPMTRVYSLAEVDAHNEYYYDIITGTVTMALASFSEIALVSDTENAWEGSVATGFSGGSGTEKDPWIIANADQLALMSKNVSNYEAYADDCYKLIADLNFGGEENANAGYVFYPIGYWKQQSGTNKAGEIYYGFGNAFRGTFDGSGHTISGIYQNTWIMDGSYDYGYWNHAMGLFGATYDATIKNLVMRDFQSDGEFTPTGCVAAYAGGTSTFENITLTYCNPRVYNTGNGGIVGLNYASTTAGNYDDLLFRNITVDNTNVISALWGSWDVGCGGIMGRLRESSHHGDSEGCLVNKATFENCHVSAVIDVYNDVCANYQYYQYRYSGMLIGTVDYIDQITHVDLKDAVKATGCTVHFGEWNNQWYCELVENSLASYTHDYQFSRLDKITAVTDIQDENGDWNKTGNFVIPNNENETLAVCYHIRKDADGNFYQHKHEEAGYETNVDVNNDGVVDEKDLLEDRQHYMFQFRQLFAGYGWGASHIFVGEFDGVTVLDNEPDAAESVTKFGSAAADSYTAEQEVKIGDLFVEITNNTTRFPIDVDNVQVFVSPANESSTVVGVYKADTADWTQGKLTFTGTGAATVTITDYYFCTPTTISITVNEKAAVEKFDVVMNNGDFLHRVGNSGTVALDKLFAEKTDVEIGTVSVTVEAVDGTGASGTYDSNADTIQFNDTGVVKVTITDNDYCTPTELYLEVVDAVNATTATSATANNVVLLNDISSGFTVSGRYTVYGNGFTLYYTGNGQYLNNGLNQGVITVKENGTLDNLRIKASIYPATYLYYQSALIGKAVKDGPCEVDGDKTRYYYQLSAVAAFGNATISNCHIYGGRTNIFVNTGDVTVKDSVLECGTLANVQIQSNADYTVTFENVTTIQQQVNPTIDNPDTEIDDTSLVMLGAGVLVGPETTENPTIVLNGEFKQYNWVTSDDASKVSDDIAEAIINGALDATDYNHTVNGKTASNLGIIYMNEYDVKVTEKSPYVLGTVTMTMSGNKVNGKVYSPQNATADQIYSDIENADRSTVNDLYQPQFKYSADLGGQYIAEGGDEHCYREGDTIYVMFPSGDTKELDLAALVNIAKYTGQDLGLVITCTDSNGNTVSLTDNIIPLSSIEEYTITYTVTDTLFYDKDGNEVAGSIKYSWDVTLSVSLKDKAIPDAYFDFDEDKQVMSYAKKVFYSTSNIQYLPFLAGLKIYDYNGQTAYLRFDGDSTGENGFQKIASVTSTYNDSTLNATVEVALTDGGKITAVFGGIADSGSKTKTGSLQVSDSVVYWVTDGETTATTTTWTIDSYSFVGNNGVTIKDTSQVFRNCVAGDTGSVPSGSFSTTINYTVTYDANGGNCGQTVGYATSANNNTVTLPTPTRSGYVFAGWYTAATGGDREGGAGDSYTPSANITLYAQWGKPSTVTYNANGGTCDTSSATYTGTALTLPTPTQDGYWCIGWYDAAEGGTKIGDAGNSYIPTTDITLYAYWQEAVEYTVTYDANGGTCGTASATYQGTALTLPTPTRTGYTFNGWSDGTSTYAAGATYTPSADITLTAQWEKTPYTITVSESGATVTGVTNGQTAYYGDTISVTVTFSKSSNKSLTVKDADGNIILNENSAGTHTFTMPDSNVTIDASSSSLCVTPDTLVTMADGTRKEIQDVSVGEKVLAWNFYVGEYEAVTVLMIADHGFDNVNVLHLNFSDGTELKLIGEHGVFDADENRYVFIDEYNVSDYVGHRFVKAESDSYTTVTLTGFRITAEYINPMSLLTEKHYNAILADMFTLTPAVINNNILMPFTVGENMKYDAAAVDAEIARYGLYEYAEFEEYISCELFTALKFDRLKVLVGKGLVTYEEIIEYFKLLKQYS